MPNVILLYNLTLIFNYISIDLYRCLIYVYKIIFTHEKKMAKRLTINGRFFNVTKYRYF